MASKKKLLQAASGVGGAGLDIPDVFSTFLYDGNSSTQAINNGIDLSGEGGLVWIKGRTGSVDHALYDTARGANSLRLSSSTTDSAVTVSGVDFSSFNSDGFTVKSGATYNYTNDNRAYASWTFRKAPKFFDVVTYTGDGNGDKTISHSLNTTVGMAIIKRYDSAGYDWHVYHRSSGTSKYLLLNSTNAEASGSIVTATSNTSITLSRSNGFNTSGATYVAYLFAHNNSDGEFGPSADQDIIKCGSYTGNGSTTGPEINLGFEPQWVMIKVATGTTDQWVIFDTMRGLVTSGDDNRLFPNLSNAEAVGDYIELTSTGFKPTLGADLVNRNTSTYIYMAIRRGPLAAPDDATKVFAMDDAQGTSGPSFTASFPVDMSFFFRRTGGDEWYNSDRLRQGKYLAMNSTAVEGTWDKMQFDYSAGWSDFTSGSSTYQSWMWKRAPSYFDMVAYSGTGSARTVPHGLTVPPEMMWVKRRESTGAWAVYHKGLNGGTTPEDYVIELNATGGEYNNANWNDTAPTSSVFSLGTANSVNNSSGTYIAYLFATVAGVSKVGSFTGTAATLNIDCGFSSGARFVLLKRTDANGEWRVFDTARGIVAGNDPLLHLHSTGAEEAFDDLIDPYSAGFTLTSSGMVNVSGGSYIFYAIA